MKNRLSGKAIRKQLCSDIASIVVLNTVDSTNSYGKLCAAKGDPLPALVLADEQTRGRGRGERSFYSPRGSGLYMSIVYTAKSSPEDALIATVCASVASAVAIEELSGRSVQIKWVNDIYLDEKKAGGILCESAFENGKMNIIVGIGINISTTDFPKFDNNTPTSVGHLDRNSLAAKIYNEFVFFSSEENREVCLEEYRKRFYLKNKKIAILRADGSSDSAIARGIDERGGLIVELDDGSAEIIRSGEVTVRESK